jgi:hypothetical protein
MKKMNHEKLIKNSRRIQELKEILVEKLYNYFRWKNFSRSKIILQRRIVKKGAKFTKKLLDELNFFYQF